jgi:predicted nucleic acid-binding protein
MWVEALDPDGDAACREKVEELIAARKAATCEIVIAELLRAAEDDAHATQLEQRLRTLRVLTVEGAGGVAAAIGRQLRAPGQRLADLLIAAVAFQHDAGLLHRDRHLARIAARFTIEQVTL